MSCPGRVVAPLAPGRALVELAPEAPARCAGGDCRCAGLAPAPAPPRLECRVEGEATAGDPVSVELPRGGGRWAGAALLLYGLPTAGLLAGTLIAERLAAPMAPLGGLAGLGAGLVLARVRERAASARAAFRARLREEPSVPDERSE